MRSDPHEAMQQASELWEQRGVAQSQPSLIFLTRLDGLALHHLLAADGTLDELAQQQAGLALALPTLDADRADVVRLLNARGLYTVAWLLPPDEETVWSVLNYPQATKYYRSFCAWAIANALRFDAVALDMGPRGELPPGPLPFSDLASQARRLGDWLRLASENPLFPAASAAYTSLAAEIARDGYSLHLYQTPLIVDDRHAGTTLLQRALNVVDLPASLEVLKCHSADSALRRVLIASYGEDADSISLDLGPAGCPPSDGAAQTWATLQRDIQLAAHYTDTVYIATLEECVAQGWLPHFARLDAFAAPALPRPILAPLRLLLLLVLLVARFFRPLVAWLGWLIVLILLLRQARQARPKGPDTREEQPR